MTTSTSNILLAGATGYIGRCVARELVQRGHHVIAPVRSLPDADVPGVDLRSVEVTSARNVAAALDGIEVDTVISCLASRSGVAQDAWRVDFEANCHLLDLARRAGATRFVLLSAICVQRPRLAFQHAKLAFEARLLESDLCATIVRPTAFFKSLSGQVSRVLAGKPFLVFGDGTATACKPIGEADLARFIVDRLEENAGESRVLPIGGPGDAITPRQQGELLFELAAKPARFRHVPAGMFTAALAVLNPLSRLSGAIAAKAELARIGHYYATESMLVWDEKQGRYRADATPATGTETLRDFYTRVLREGLAGQELGEQKLF